MKPQRKIGVVLSANPDTSKLSHDEISGLERHGMPLHIFSLHPPNRDVVNSYTRALHSPETYVPAKYAALTPIIRAHLELLAQYPVRYFATLGCLFRRGNDRRLRRFNKAAWLAARSGRANVVHMHVYFTEELGGIIGLVQRLTGVTLSITIDAKHLRSVPRETLRRTLGGASFVIAQTKPGERSPYAPLPPKISVKYARCGFDATRYRPNPNRSRTAQAPVILSVGRLSEKRGFITLIRACRILHSLGLRFRCEIVGDGPNRPQLQSSIKAMGLEGVVTLTGGLSHETIMDRYRDASVFVLPCQVSERNNRSGFPKVLFEAMAMELPIVAAPILGIPEIIEHEANGLLVATENPAALANEIQRLLRRPLLRARLGAAGRRTIHRAYAGESNVNQLFDLLIEATASGSKRPPSTFLRRQSYA